MSKDKDRKIKIKMSLPNHKYNLRSGPFGLCSGYWDNNSHIFRRADQTEEGDCCLRTCKPFIDQCVKTCPRGSTDSIRKRCYLACNNMKEICESNCMLSSELWGANNPIFEGTSKYGCGNGFEQSIDIDCVINNKDDIIKFCGKQCTPTSGIDCQEHCEYSYDMIINKGENPLNIIIPDDKGDDKGINKGVNKGTQVVGKNNGVLYVLYVYLISVVLLGVYILISSQWRSK